MSGTLFVVATPIGNLEDITLRALRVLREVDVVAAEDTRRSGNLLRHFQIETPLLSLHEHNETLRIPKLLDHLRAGRSVALVTDAGTPGISDPGATVVRAVREAGFAVVPVPGASAVAAAISVAGLEDGRFAFAGFPPTRSKDREGWFEWLAAHRDLAVVFFEAPHRISRTLSELSSVSGIQPIVVGREVTKMHEEWQFAPAERLAKHFTDSHGEFVIVIPPADPTTSQIEAPADADILALFGQITEMGCGRRREAVRQVAETLKLPTKYVYEAIERAKKIG